MWTPCMKGICWDLNAWGRQDRTHAPAPNSSRFLGWLEGSGCYGLLDEMLMVGRVSFVHGTFPLLQLLSSSLYPDEVWYVSVVHRIWTTFSGWKLAVRISTRSYKMEAAVLSECDPCRDWTQREGVLVGVLEATLLVWCASLYEPILITQRSGIKRDL